MCRRSLTLSMFQNLNLPESSEAIFIFYICIKLVYPKYPIHQHVFQAKAFTVYIRSKHCPSHRIRPTVNHITSLYTTHTRHLATCKLEKIP